MLGTIIIINANDLFPYSKILINAYRTPGTFLDALGRKSWLDENSDFQFLGIDQQHFNREEVVEDKSIHRF